MPASLNGVVHSLNLSLYVLIGWIAISPTQSTAQDLTSIHRDCLHHFWTAAENTNRPVTVLSFGDSMADSYRSIPFVLMNQMVQQLGSAGHSMQGYQNALMYRLEGTAAQEPPGPFWFTSHFRLPAGAAVWWENQYIPGGVNSDRAGVFYVSHPGGGDFKLVISSNAGPWVTALTVNAQSPCPQGEFMKLDLPLGLHRVRVESVSGINYILGPQLLNRTSNGVHAVFTDQGGIPLSAVTRVPLAIRKPVFQELAPDLLIWHMKEDGGATTAAGLLECEQWWRESTPNTDVLYIGTPWVGLDSTTPYTISQNNLLRSTALSNQRAYVDCMTPAVSYSWMVAQGYMSDDTHVNLQGSTYLGNLAWYDLNFFLLRRARTLSIMHAHAGIELKYPTSTGVRYTLERSSRLSGWKEFASDAGSGATVTRTVASPLAQEFFRLRLEPVR